jgi:ribonuclease BN (tRNA processing enzyme)
MQVQFIGCGDAFGTGGRLNTCFHLRGARTSALIDCGASALIGLKRCGVDRDAIDLILTTHFHADHFGGIPFFILDAQFVTKRTRPLTIAGPPGLPSWYARWMETAFAGSSQTRQKFPLALVELKIRAANALGTLTVTPYEVRHSDPAGPCLGLRIEAEGRVLGFSGDTEWVEDLVAIGRDADLFLCESYVPEGEIKGHLALATLQQRLPDIRPKRLILTHMGEAMYARREQAGHEVAEDGMIVTF